MNFVDVRSAPRDRAKTLHLEPPMHSGPALMRLVTKSSANAATPSIRNDKKAAPCATLPSGFGQNSYARDNLCMHSLTSSKVMHSCSNSKLSSLS